MEINNNKIIQYRNTQRFIASLSPLFNPLPKPWVARYLTGYCFFFSLDNKAIAKKKNDIDQQADLLFFIFFPLFVCPVLFVKSAFFILIMFLQVTVVKRRKRKEGAKRFAIAWYHLQNCLT